MNASCPCEPTYVFMQRKACIRTWKKESIQAFGDISTHPCLRANRNPAPTQTLNQGRVGMIHETWIDPPKKGEICPKVAEI